MTGRAATGRSAANRAMTAEIPGPARIVRASRAIATSVRKAIGRDRIARATTGSRAPATPGGIIRAAKAATNGPNALTSTGRRSAGAENIANASRIEIFADASPEPAPAKAKKAGDRIAKLMARAGLCSRRDAEEWIRQGRVSVNGRVITSPALDVTAHDTVLVDDAPLPERERTRLFLYHKPKGLVTTHADPEGRPTVFDLAARRTAAADLDRPARLQRRGAVAADQRRRPGARARIAGHRLDAALPGARAWRDRAGEARRAAQGRRGRRREVWADRSDAGAQFPAPMCGSCLRSAKARTARCAT